MERVLVSDEPVDSLAKVIRFFMNTDYLKRTLSYEVIAADSQSSINLNEEAVESVVFATLSNVYYLCDEGYNKGKRFTGALVGMYAYGGEKAPLTVRFSNCNYIDI